MNTVGKAKAMRGTRNGRHRPVRWFTVLMSVAVLSVSGAVMADIILTYTARTGVSPSGVSPFEWANGGNYALANTYGLTFQNITNKNSAVTTTLGTIAGVNIETLNITNFDLQLAIPAGHQAWIQALAAFGTNTAPAGVACAYAFVTTYVPDPNGSRASLAGGAIGSCTAFVPQATSPAHFGQGCASSGVDTFNLTAGTLVGADAIATKCHLSSVSSTGIATLYVSFAIDAWGGVVAANMNGYQVPVIMT